ncbi:hypothetical protein SARC_17571 [Sphaeroforma arctica JP610]|uniref:Uncharacterized protein n=1 Tax=Sphaeroforma arctica JP610 TaxID=667725 RepID=A0A0L0EZW5_9EUKA|nr:hypothetical protein SARC_17571 [Sphaeroforma arctica JP610]KNC69909.1 hypothetical protein SARC_17571 [Sphaeroforma arctica JP610]|eukprot:XP_014143811.1 hypothetical protein SARC_17571 [Sphaeroforma arctica JP610]
MVFGGVLGRGGMSLAEVDVLVHKKTSEAHQQIQQQPQQRPSSQSGEFDSALRTPEANPVAWLQEKLDDTLAKQHQMTDDIEGLNRDLAESDRQIAQFRHLYAEVHRSVKESINGNGSELLAIKTQSTVATSSEVVGTLSMTSQTCMLIHSLPTSDPPPSPTSSTKTEDTNPLECVGSKEVDSSMEPPAPTNIVVSPTVQISRDKAQETAKKPPDAAESADKEDGTPPAVTPMFFNPIGYGKRMVFPSG